VVMVGMNSSFSENQSGARKTRAGDAEMVA